MIKFQLVSVVELRPRLEILLPRHLTEVSGGECTVPAPRWDAYCRLDAAGRLVLAAAEDGRELVGYCCFILDRSLHNESLIVAMNDAIYINPEHRGPGVASRLIAFCEAEAVRRGAGEASMNVKIIHNFGPLLERDGYTHIENVHHKKLKH